MASPVSLDPVARATWHPVALARDLAAGAVRPVTVLGEEVVLWRDSTGVHAWQDLCIHRGVRLSPGTVENGALRCAYHGGDELSARGWFCGKRLGGCDESSG